MHIKDFLNWSKLKQKIDDELVRPNVKVREIRWCSLGHNIGSEIDGKGDNFARPVLILKFISKNTCLVLPLTHSEKNGPFICEFDFKEERIKSRMDQLRIIDIKRLNTKLGELSENKFKTVLEKCKNFLFNENYL